MTDLARRHWWLVAAARYLGLVSLGYYLAWLLRFDFVLPANEMNNFYRGFAVAVCVKLLICLILGLRLERWWGHQSFHDLIRLLGTSLLTSAVAGAMIYAIVGREFPRSIYFLDPLICFLLVGGARFASRLYDEVKSQ